MKLIELSQNDKLRILGKYKDRFTRFIFNDDNIRSTKKISADQISNQAFESDNFIVFTYKNNPHPQIDKILLETAFHAEKSYKDLCQIIEKPKTPKHKFAIYVTEPTKNGSLKGQAFSYGFCIQAPSENFYTTSNQKTLKHEMVHMFESIFIGKDELTPRWWSEGIACYLAGQEILETPGELNEIRSEQNQNINPLCADIKGYKAFPYYPTYTLAVKYLLDKKGGNLLSKNALPKFFKEIKKQSEHYHDHIVSEYDCGFKAAFNANAKNNNKVKSYKYFTESFFSHSYSQYMNQYSWTIKNTGELNEFMIVSGPKYNSSSEILAESPMEKNKIYFDAATLSDGKYLMIFFNIDQGIKTAVGKEILIKNGQLQGYKKSIDIVNWENKMIQNLPISFFTEFEDPEQTSIDPKLKVHRKQNSFIYNYGNDALGIQSKSKVTKSFIDTIKQREVLLPAKSL